MVGCSEGFTKGKALGKSLASTVRFLLIFLTLLSANLRFANREAGGGLDLVTVSNIEERWLARLGLGRN